MMRASLLLLCVAAALSAGCASTASRIDDNRALFDSLSPAVQANVRAGKIEVGYAREVVVLALGLPSRVLTRETRDSETDVWIYGGVTSPHTHRLATSPYVYRDARGRWCRTYDSHWLDVDDRYRNERLRVEFDADGVVAIESRP